MDPAAVLLYAALSGAPAINVPEAEPLNSRYAEQIGYRENFGFGILCCQK